MPPTCAYDILSQNPLLMVKLDANFSVSSALQGLFIYIADMATSAGRNLTGIRATISVVNDGMADDGYLHGTLLIDFTQDELARPVILADKKILWQRNLVIAQVLQVNDNIRDLARNLVATLEQLGSRYRLPWEEIRCGSKRIMVRRGGRRLEMDLGQKEWLPDEEMDQAIQE